MHKQRLLSIDNAIETISSYYAVRFGGLLGKDNQGRTYWALYPRIEEMTAARDFLIAMSCGRLSEKAGSISKTKKEQVGTEVRLRGDSKKWPHFIAVWGQVPKENEKIADCEDTDDGDAEEKWWAFDDAGEIRKLVIWLNGQDKDSGLKGDNDTLSKRLIQFANSLEWRGKVNRYALPN
ncbi:hypothetical protein AX15_004213 [Amanita polypyramis BW_CC]|nr:hypothetical protein AX15_004213 [Amanita polypyramis BW_CC]